jgi:hypothetical protein
MLPLQEGRDVHRTITYTDTDTHTHTQEEKEEEEEEEGGGGVEGSLFFPSLQEGKTREKMVRHITSWCEKVNNA